MEIISKFNVKTERLRRHIFIHEKIWTQEEKNTLLNLTYLY
jgi:hypothetical protein